MTKTTRSCCLQALSPLCWASTIGGRPKSPKGGDYNTKKIIDPLTTRRQIRVSKIIVHEYYHDDIALLSLGKKDHFKIQLKLTVNSQRRGWIYQSSVLSVFLTLVKAF